MEFSRPIPPPPPPNIHNEQHVETPTTEQENTHKNKSLSPKTMFGLLIAGGVLSLAVAATCIVLIFIL